MKELKCIECGRDRELGRKRCRTCTLKLKREQANARDKKYGRHKYDVICEVCKLPIKANRKKQRFCMSCYKHIRSIKQNKNPYVYSYDKEEKKGNVLHRHIAEKLLKRKLTFNEVVHHLDFNPINNNINNLIVLSRGVHRRLHNYLDIQRVIIEKSITENFENCWNTLRVPMTTAWLETTNAKVIKLWEIEQSASEDLSSKEYDQGSETMYETPKPVMVGDDIVQTTTETVSEN